MEDRLLSALTAPGSPRKIDDTDLRLFKNFLSDEVRSNLAKVRMHPLGFAYFTRDIGQSCTLRFHVWTRESAISDAQSTGDIHDHVFELNSAILAGELRQETFQFSDADEGEHEIAHVEYVGNRSIVRPSGHRGNLLVISDDVFEAGQAYRLQSRVIHRARPHKMPMATIVLARLKPNPPIPRVVVQCGGNVPGDFDRRLLAISEKDLLVSTISKLAES